MAKSKKKANKLSGLIVLVTLALAIATIVLMFATTAVVVKGQVLGFGDKTEVPGIACVFGNKENELKVTWAGMTAFILATLAVILLVLAMAGSLLKVKQLKKNWNGLAILAGLLLIGAGVCMFFVVSAFKSANGLSSGSLLGLASVDYKLGVGWIITAIVSMLSGVLAVASAVLK